MNEAKYRLITRGDFDGVVCAALFRELELVEEVVFAHPKDMQDSKISVSDTDIIANLPYVDGCHMAFDHHASEITRMGQPAQDRWVNNPASPSAARVIFDHYGGADKFPRVSEALMAAVDKADSAQFTADEVLNPTGWVLLNYVMDSRTGLGRFRDFRITNEQLLLNLVDYCREKPVEDILLVPDVSERVRLYFEHEQYFRKQLLDRGKVVGNLLEIDLRDTDVIYAGNRFLPYALYEDVNVSMHVLNGAKGNTVFAIGKSVLNRTCDVHIGELCLEFGGGGHAGAGTCQVENPRAAETAAILRSRLR